MSSSRKRAAIAKANREVDYLNQKLMMTEHHLSITELLAKVCAQKYDELKIEHYELKLKYCPETITEKETAAYNKSKAMLEAMKAAQQSQEDNPIPQLIFAEEDYEKANLVTTPVE